MKATKIVLLIVVVLVVITIVWRRGVILGYMAGNSSSDVAPDQLPSITEIMSKGYNLEEANQIFDALQNGKDINW